MGANEKALNALGDPTRRAVFELLRDGSRPVGDLANRLPVTRPAVSRHLRVLREHGLVRSRVQAQRRLYSLDAAPLAELDEWLARYRGFWSQRLDALDTQLRRARRRKEV